MTNTKDIQRALRAYIDDAYGGAPIEFAKEFGVTPSTVSRWCTGTAKEIGHKNWPRLSALIEPFLTQTTSLADFSTNDLLAEIRRRMR